MYTYYVAAGSNLGDRSANLSNAIAMMNVRCGTILRTAPFYQNPAVGMAKEEFINTACVCESSLLPVSFLNVLMEIERLLGRDRNSESGDRPIDLDIIHIEDDQRNAIAYDNDRLTVPHPRAESRNFVMVPLAAIAPNVRFKAQQPTFQQIAKSLGMSSLKII